MAAKSRTTTRSSCECADSHCPVHECDNFCERAATMTLHRVDMEDTTGVRFCSACGEDALMSGLFTSD